MPTGIECIGLVLAILPLLMAAAEHYREGLDSLQAIRAKVGDDRLLEFYEEIAFEIFQLRHSIKKLVKDLPGFSYEYKSRLVKAVDPNVWRDEALSRALSNKLGEENDRLFSDTLRRVVESLNALVSDDQEKLSKKEVNQNVFCTKLTNLRKDIFAGVPASTLRSRVQFCARQSKRARQLERIAKYNGRLQRLLEDTSHAEVMEFDLRNKTPSPMVRTYAHTLHKVLSCCWQCDCPAPHKEILCEAMLCLNRHRSAESSSDISFDLLFSTKPRAETSPRPRYTWQEGVVHIWSQGSPPLKLQSEQVDRLCKIIEGARDQGLCIQMLLEDQKLWHIKPEAKRLEPQCNVSLESLLLSSTKWPLKDRRLLAVTLANTVLQVSEGPWLNKNWDKNHISFFETAQNLIDFKRPYLTTGFHQDPPDNVKEGSAFQSIHPNPSLLALGILLLEIDPKKPMEISPLDLTNGKVRNANTELTAAMRFFKESVDDLYDDYRKAIRACLEPNFLHLNQMGSLDTEDVRQSVYECIVAPLEAELYKGFHLKAPSL